MPIITGTTGDDSILRGVNSAGVVVITPPSGPNAGEDDLVLALAGNDVVAPGDGDDTAFLGSGDDRFIWDPGEGSDVVRGGQGVDTLEFNGSDAVEIFTISDTQLLRDVGNIQMDLTSIERIELNGLDGDDVIDATALTEAVALIVNGGRGNDTATLGAGDDRFIWNPGDGSDVVDGRDGTDTLEFNGSDAVETFTISDADGGVQLFRDVGNILMDLTNVERIELNGLGGNDLVDAASLTQDVELIIDAGEGDDVVIAGVSSDVLRGGGGSEFMLGGTGSDRFVFGIEASDGTTDLDTIGDYEIGSDVIDLAEAGGLAGSEQVTGGLLLTLAGADGDQVFLANVDAIDDVMIA